jgi:hypothetical protein
VTGRIVDAKAEADGDIHLALQDATGDAVGTVSAEIPVGPKWCEIRQTVFGWTTQKFPFNVKTAHTLKLRELHVITVTGKAFYDIAHAPADHSNRRRTPSHSRQQRSFKVPISFLAKTLITGTYTGANVTLATPLYIAQVS